MLPVLESTTKVGFFCDNPPQLLCKSGTAKCGTMRRLRATQRGVRSAHATDEAGTLSEGESRAKVQALREGSSGLLTGEGYSKPPAGTTRTAAGGFALAGVPQERESGHYIRERSSWALLRSDLPWMGAPKE